jgi:hypothetical protein
LPVNREPTKRALRWSSRKVSGWRAA